MLLNEFELSYVSKRIKEETGVDMDLKKVHIDNVVPITDTNRRKFLETVVSTFIDIKDSKPMTAEEFDDGCNLEFKSLDEWK